ncbi:hypothetical protein EDD18DRAFT_1201988 [Armillaria luteobubalina]|uniref:TspO/MBR-related protein n=1 Tax=Armillaria luteobubalina TaxID=153913 RepID=A0AA39PEW9_9AGAR|nr:hypothetical protein EDD18DRAFT_1201988 [Armillaria luteobubalina]
MSEIYLPAILLDIPRNTVAAIGLPLCLGILSGSSTARVVRGDWYKNLRGPPGALVDSVLLAGTTFYMTKILDRPTKSLSTYLLLPYCAWLTFATYLNGGIWWLNRGQRPKKD